MRATLRFTSSVFVNVGCLLVAVSDHMSYVKRETPKSNAAIWFDHDDYRSWEPYGNEQQYDLEIMCVPSTIKATIYKMVWSVGTLSWMEFTLPTTYWKSRRNLRAFWSSPFIGGRNLFRFSHKKFKTRIFILVQLHFDTTSMTYIEGLLVSERILLSAHSAFKTLLVLRLDMQSCVLVRVLALVFRTAEF